MIKGEKKLHASRNKTKNQFKIIFLWIFLCNKQINMHF
jgi:hypothetical protein